jgi:hypothetical protein
MNMNINSNFKNNECNNNNNNKMKYNSTSHPSETTLSSLNIETNKQKSSKLENFFNKLLKEDQEQEGEGEVDEKKIEKNNEIDNIKKTNHFCCLCCQLKFNSNNQFLEHFNENEKANNNNSQHHHKHLNLTKEQKVCLTKKNQLNFIFKIIIKIKKQKKKRNSLKTT